MPLQLGPWYCDVCDQLLTAKEGYVLWDHEGGRDGPFQIIHQDRCDSNQLPSSYPLDNFVGPDGIIYLTRFLAHGPLIPGPPPPGVADMEHFIDFVRRVQVPGYEQARRRFGEAEILERFHDANPLFPYLQDTLRSIIQ